MSDEQLNLGELIAELEGRPRERGVAIGLARPHSHRGRYSDLAFEPQVGTSVGDILDAARGTVGKSFPSWKGGLYTMCAETPVYVAHEGCVGAPLDWAMLEAMIGPRNAGTGASTDRVMPSGWGRRNRPRRR